MPELGGNLIFNIPDISFSIPIRKKLKLEGVNGGIRGLDASGNMEVSIAWSAMGTCRLTKSHVLPTDILCRPRLLLTSAGSRKAST